MASMGARSRPRSSQSQNDKFSQIFCSCPIRTLAVVFHKVVAGCGNQLLIYNKENFELEAKHEVLEGASIHGICKGPLTKPDQQLLCVYGAKETRIVALKEVMSGRCNLEILTQIFRVKDWIWEARWLKNQPESIALALAHNSVSFLDWKLGDITMFRHCVENCILYCAHFIGETWNTLVLAAGTVFNQVVLWAVGSVGNDVVPQMNVEAVPVIHTLSGHKGVIFSIRYHPEHQRLCTVSDDRSIQMWQLSFPHGSCKAPSVEDWKSVESQLLMTLFGHTARVWDVVLLTQCFASVGEDATCFVWNYDGKILSKFKGHKGKSIWSIAATEDENVLITGGGDGSVRMWEIHAESAWSSSQYDVDIPKDLTSVEEDFPRIVTLLSYNVVLVMMNSGCLASYSVASHFWKSLFEDRRFVSYSIVTPCLDKKKIAVGSITGVIKILLIEEDDMNAGVVQTEKDLFDGKVMGIVWMTVDILLVSGPEGQCIILKVVTVQDLHESSIKIISCQSLFLPPSKHRWITACCALPLQSQQMLLCGDKNGSVHSYLCPELDSKSVENESSVIYQPTQTFYRVHGKTGITSITCKDGLVYSTGRDGYYRQWEAKGEELILRLSVKVTKGFDWIDRMEWSADDMLMYGFLSSYFVIWSVPCNQQIVSIHCGGGHRSWGCCLDGDALCFTYLKAGKIFLVDSKQCVKQSLLKPPLHGRELCDVKFIREIESSDGSPAFLICTTSEDTTINIGLLSGKESLTIWKPLLSLKGHLSSVRCVAISQECQEEMPKEAGRSDVEPVQRNHVPNCHFLFTGGGRAEIRVWKLCVSNDSQIAFENVKGSPCDPSIELHLNDVESKIDIDKDKRPVDSTHACKFDQRDLLVKCNYEELSTHFLGESRHKNRYSNWKTKKLHLDPETRIMSLAATPLTAFKCQSQGTYLNNFQDEEIQRVIQDLHIISAAGSDGVLRIFSYNCSTRQLDSIQQSSAHKGCVLKVLHFIHSTNHSFCAYLLFSTSTNGCIMVWSLSDILQKLFILLRKTNSTTTKRQESIKRRNSGEKVQRHIASQISPDHIAPNTDTISTDESDSDGEYTDFSLPSEKVEMDSSSWQPMCQLKSHQSGVNSISVCSYRDNIILLASGGDDNALTVQMLKIEDKKVTLLSKTMKTDAHAAQITGLWFVSPSTVVSASIDQRICVWDVDLQLPDMKVVLMKCKYVHIADISSMDVYCHRDSIYLLIGGEGICVYSFK